MSKRYAVAMYALRIMLMRDRTENIQVQTAFLWCTGAESRKDAVAAGLKRMREKCTEEDGWIYHGADALELEAFERSIRDAAEDEEGEDDA